MKTLNNYIKESLLDDEEDLLKSNSVIIEKFLTDNYELSKCTYTIENDIVNVKGLIHPKKRSIKALTDGSFKFGAVDQFYCIGCYNLTSLNGSPEIVNNGFDCSECDKLTNLDGAPSQVLGNFYCNECKNLISLKGSPKKVKGVFDCSGAAIKDLTGITQNIEGVLDCSFCDNLESLKGSPKQLKGSLILVECLKLKTLKYCPKEIGEFIKYPKSIENIRDEIKKHNIKVKKVVSETGELTIQI